MRRISSFVVVVLCVLGLPVISSGEEPPLLPRATVAALASELSGESAKRTLEYLTRLHRMRGSRDFRAAAEFVVSELTRAGFADAHIETFPLDGHTFYGTQKARLAWQPESAELWELESRDGRDVRRVRLASYDARPITLAQDSESADVTADLVDVGAGTKESDYAGKTVKGAIVLASAQPGAVARIAVDRLGAAGILSYAQNQKTAWSGDDDTLVRWGHLGSFRDRTGFAFMASLHTAREFRARLAAGEHVRLEAHVKASRVPGTFDIATATIPGADPTVGGEEIVYSCHLDHQRPGANDNASGCSTILEVARTFSTLVRRGALPRPRRTIRFLWPPEIEGTMAVVFGRPEMSKRFVAAVHLDMVGGGPVTKAIFRVTRGPMSLPSFVHDVAAAFGTYANRQSEQFASGLAADFPLVAPEGGKEALLGLLSEHSMGSDHDVYNEASVGVPSIYMNDWPDRYIHTDADRAANIDPTKLLRAGFIASASGWFLANLGEADAERLWTVVRSAALSRTAEMIQRRLSLSPQERFAFTNAHFWYERSVFESTRRWLPVTPDMQQRAGTFYLELERIVKDPDRQPGSTAGVVFERTNAARGPMHELFEFDYVRDRLGDAATDALRLLQHEGARAGGGEYAYEVLNFVDGTRNVGEVRDLVSAEYGPVPLDVVVEYLRALETIGVVREKK